MKKFIIIAFSLLLIPTYVSAAWWNPFSWAKHTINNKFNADLNVFQKEPKKEIQKEEKSKELIKYIETENTAKIDKLSADYQNLLNQYNQLNQDYQNLVVKWNNLVEQYNRKDEEAKKMVKEAMERMAIEAAKIMNQREKALVDQYIASLTDFIKFNNSISLPPIPYYPKSVHCYTQGFGDSFGGTTGTIDCY